MLASYGYDALGRRSSVTFGNGTVQTLTFDAASRLTGLAHDLAGTAQDQSVTFGYNAAGQIATTTRSNDAYAWGQHYNIDRLYSVNGLNQILSAGQLGIGYDGRGNLTSSGTSTYSYNADNLMVSGPNGASLAYDPLGRLAQSVGNGVTTRFAYDGINLIAEYNASNVMLRRYVHGPGSDEPIVWYEGSGTTDRRFLMRDERGSIVSVTNASGTTLAINAYDEYGIPASTNLGRFQFTGQTWLPEVGLYYYKARMYSPTLGRFMQTDPIGYADGMNWYAYVGNDPVNYVDPLGLEAGFGGPGRKDDTDSDDIVVTGPSRPRNICDDTRNRNLPECNDPIRIPDITIDSSCDPIRDLLGSRAARAAIAEVINRSTTPNGTTGRSEHARWLGRDWQGNVFATAIWSDGLQSNIVPHGVRASSSRGNFFSNALQGRGTPDILIHGHPNNAPPSSISPLDAAAARSEQITVVAADSAGNVTCAFRSN